MAGFDQACPGHPRRAVSKTRSTLPQSGAKANRTRLSGRVPLLVVRCAEPREWPGASPATTPPFAFAGPSQFRVPTTSTYRLRAGTLALKALGVGGDRILFFSHGRA